LLFFTHREPRYHGKPVSYWFRQQLIPSKNSHSGEAMRTLGPAAVPFLVSALTGRDSRFALFYFKHYPKIPNFLRVRLPAPIPAEQKRWIALHNLETLGPQAQPAVPALLALYKDSARTGGPFVASGAMPYITLEPVRARVLTALVHIGGSDPAIVAAFLDAARDKNPMLGSYGPLDSGLPLSPLKPAVANALAELREAAESSDPHVRSMAIQLLTMLASDRDDLTSLFLRGLDDPIPDVRRRSAQALGHVRHDLHRVVSPLTSRLVDTNGQVSMAAANALKSIHSNQNDVVGPELTAALTNPDAQLRASAGKLLGDLAPVSSDSIPALSIATLDSERSVRYEAAWALWKIDQQPDALIPFRIEELTNANEVVRWDAAVFLGERGSRAAAAVPTLIQVLTNDSSNRLRGRAAMSLGQMGTEARSAIPALNTALHDQFVNVSLAAAQALKKIPPL
jgi:HEAT repeat protein